jgi:hypothetical protein
VDGWGRRFIGDSLEQTGKAERDAGNEQKARKGNAIRESALDDMLKLDSVIAYIKKVNADVDYASEGPYPKSRDRGRGARIQISFYLEIFFVRLYLLGLFISAFARTHQ